LEKYGSNLGRKDSQRPISWKCREKLTRSAKKEYEHITVICTPNPIFTILPFPRLMTLSPIYPIIAAKDLVALSPETYLLVDASFGKANFEKKHLKGSLHVDLNADLSDIKDNAANGGRHPLPSTEKFCALLSRLGISPETHVVVYDDKNGANAAARFWWMMRAIGHQKIQVLDGGLAAAESAGFPIESGEGDIPNSATYPAKGWILPLSNIQEVERVSQDPDFLVIDVRENYRYRGESEPIDLVAGHIPGSVNVPYFSNLDETGKYLPAEQLREKYSELVGSRNPGNIIVHCGSGVTACHTLLAFAQAGLDIPKLYVGSWSEWSRNDKPIATEI
jgi:thiosulfate/3-mercaptopyruvate sulfurtransferase